MIKSCVQLQIAMPDGDNNDWEEDADDYDQSVDDDNEDCCRSFLSTH